MCNLTAKDNKRTNDRLESALQFLMKEARSRKDGIPVQEFRLLKKHSDIRKMLLEIYKKGLQHGAMRACSIVYTTYYEAQSRMRD
jgi:hypothetical protein